MARKPQEPRSEFAKTLVSLCDELQGREDLEGVHLTFNRKAAKSSLKAALGIEFPEALVPTYTGNDGLLFEWEERGTRGGEGDYVFGRLRLLPINDGFYVPWGGVLGFIGPEPTEPEALWAHQMANYLRGLDAPQPEEFTHVIGMDGRRRTGAAKKRPARLWFFDATGPKFPLDLDGASYLEEARALHAIDGWHAIFADVDGMPESQRGLLWVVVERAERALAHFDRLFPGRSRPDHAERVQALLATRSA